MNWEIQRLLDVIVKVLIEINVSRKDTFQVHFELIQLLTDNLCIIFESFVEINGNTVTQVDLGVNIKENDLKIIPVQRAQFFFIKINFFIGTIVGNTCKVPRRSA